MDDIREFGESDDLRRQTALIHKRLLDLLHVALRAQDQQTSSEEGSSRVYRPWMRDWTENRLADLNLWVDGISALAGPGASSSLRVFKPVIESLLTLLGSFLDMCLNRDTLNHDDDNADKFDWNRESDMDTGYLSPWSEEVGDISDDELSIDSPTGQQVNNFVADETGKIPITLREDSASHGSLLESMRAAESVLSQLIRLAFKIRQSASTGGSRDLDVPLDSKEQTLFRQDLIAMLCAPTDHSDTSLGVYTPPQSHNTEHDLSMAQIRLINSALRRRNNLEFAWKHTNSPMPSRPSTQHDLKPVLARAFVTSGVLQYPEALRVVVNNGASALQCPCCARFFPESFVENPRHWRKHIDRDLLPYVCPVDDCDAPDISYGSAEEWKSHLTQKHNRAIYWRCPACGEEVETSHDFNSHVQQKHENIIATDLLDDFAESCKQSELVPLTCPICGGGSYCDLDLIGEHIHNFSMLSVPTPSPSLSPEEHIAESSMPPTMIMYRGYMETQPSLGMPEIVPFSKKRPMSAEDPGFDAILSIGSMRPDYSAPASAPNQPHNDAGKETRDLIYGTRNISPLKPPGADTFPRAPSLSTPHLVRTVASKFQGWKTPARILCLDGGGVRGLSSLMILRKIMEKVADHEGGEYRSLRPCDYFDLICGTSTGGIIALLLGRLKLTVDEAMERYIMLSQSVFSVDRAHLALWKRSKSGEPKFDEKILEQKMKETVSGCYGETEDSRLYDPLQVEGRASRQCHVAVVAGIANDTKDRVPRLLRTYERNDQCSIWQAARATSASPYYFNAIEIGSPSITYADAGLDFCNPAWLAYEEMQRLWPNRDIGVFLSIGTGTESLQSIRPKRSHLDNVLRLEVSQAQIELSKSATRVHRQLYTHFRAHNNELVYFRFNVDTTFADDDLQEWQNVLELAESTDVYMKQRETSHAYLTCAASISQFSTKTKPVLLPASGFEVDLDYAGQGTRHWYRQDVGLSGYPSTIEIGRDFENNDTKPVGTGILSLRPAVNILIRGEVLGVVSGRYRVSWLLWIWADKSAASEGVQRISHSRRDMENTNTVKESLSTVSRSAALEIDSNSSALTGLKLSVGRAKSLVSFLDTDVDRHKHPDAAEFLLCKGYGEQCVDVSLWDTLRGTGWAEARDTIIDVDVDGCLAFVMSADRLGGLSFGGVRLEPVVK